MKRHLLSAIAAAAAMVLGSAAHAGPVIIDGTDSADHGNNTGGTNNLGWEYMQRALTNLGSAVSGTVAQVVTVIGTNAASQSRNAITSALALSGVSGWAVNYVSGAANINSFMSTLSTTTTGLLYLSTAGLVSGDMDAAELAEVNLAAAQINTFVSGALGGALFAQGEVGANSFDWLATLIPGIVVTDIGAGGLGTDISLTAAGNLAFPLLTNADLAGADPWHNYFSGNLGGLSILGTAPQSTNTRNVILGGGTDTSIQCGQQGQPACPTPEPGSMLLVATAGLALLGLRRRRQSK